MNDQRFLRCLTAFAIVTTMSPVFCHAGGNCAMTSTGLIPLTDLGTSTYQGFQGGLYPGGSSVRPAAHEADGLIQAAEVVPRDALGNPDPNGKIVILTVGMSNTKLEADLFAGWVKFDPVRHPSVMVVNGAIGGLTAANLYNRGAIHEQQIDQALSAKGVTGKQVQVIWYKQANENPSQPFPQHAQLLQTHNTWIIQELRKAYPNTRLCYVTSRIYGGYAIGPTNPEPIAYETGFAYQWMVERQIAGAPELNFDPSRGPVMAPWISWGPYVWADGEVLRSDGMSWACVDFTSDGLHPTGMGGNRVAGFLWRFFQNDATAAWYQNSTAATSVTLPNPETWSVGTPRPNPFGSQLAVPLQILEPSTVTATVYSLAGRRVRTLHDAVLGAGTHQLLWDGRDEQNRSVVSGTYLVRINSGSETRTVKATLIR